jgi:hypothetical protein
MARLGTAWPALDDSHQMEVEFESIREMLT